MFFLVLKAIKREIGPTLPRYIVIMIMILPHIFSVGVRSLVSPTVAVALTVSYAMSMISASVTAESNMVDINIIINETVITATALLIACRDILLWKRERSSLFFFFFYAEKNSTAMVTVLTPPAVPTGEPPMNMRNSEKTAEVLVRFCCGTEANPAVLVVMD